MLLTRPSWLNTGLVSAVGIFAGVLLVALLSWCAMNGAVQGGSGWLAPAMPTPDMVAGWLMLLLLLCTMGAILTGAGARSLGSLAIGMAMVVTAVLPALALAVLGSGLLGFMAVLRILAILAAWSMWCAAVAWLLRPLGAAMAVGGTATAAMLALGMPVILMPLLAELAKLSVRWPLALVVNACPALWLLDATDQALRFNWFWWSHARLMYQMTGLGQNMPMPGLRPWWLATAICAALAVVIVVAGKDRAKNLLKGD